jgi:hypothetical protein
MTPQELSDFMADNQSIIINATCCGCNLPMRITAERVSATEIQVEGGAMFKVPDHWQEEEPYLFKCTGCYTQHPAFGHRTEVYSRCVGYLRPVSNWNGAKQSEFELRRTYRAE